MKLTDKNIKGLKPRERRYDVTDSDRRGLMLRVQPTGTKTFFYRYHINGRQFRVKLGNYPVMTLHMAREAYQVLANRVRRGTNVAVDIHQEQSETVALLAEQWLRQIKRQRKRPEDTARRINAVVAELGTLPVTRVTRADLRNVLADMADRVPVAANRLYSELKQMFVFAVEWGYLEHSPMDKMKKLPGGPETSRDRCLIEAEIRTFWHKLDTSKMSGDMRRALRVLLATGQRRGEVVQAAWDEFDIEKVLWTIPAERIKGKKGKTSPHVVPLSPLALDLLGKPSGGWVFPGKGGPVRPEAVTHALAKSREHFGVDPFTVHDLRRTAATHRLTTELQHDTCNHMPVFPERTVPSAVREGFGTELPSH
jgi:integrase